MLSLRQKQIALYALATAAVAGAAIAPLLAWQSEYDRFTRVADDPATSRPAVNTPQAQTNPQPSNGLAKDQIKPVTDRHWRRRLFEPEPEPEPEPKEPEPPPLRVKLVGTIVEPNRTKAVLRTNDGRTLFKKVGQAIEGQPKPATLVGIEPELVKVKYAGEVVTLKRSEQGRR